MNLSHIAETVAQIPNGIRNLAEWHENGFKPVDNSVAQNRSDICTGRISGNRCPKNKNPAFRLPDAVAEIVKSQMEKKHGIKAVVQGEENLRICMACKCILSLKVHEPIELILSHTDSDTMKKFPYFCWIKSER